jgi:two-component system LytT family sensor kinase
LSRSQQEWVRLAEEPDFVRAWLAVVKARFGERLDVCIRVDACAEAVTIPVMLIQALVEKAVKHGTSQAPGVGRVHVNVFIEGEDRIVRTDRRQQSRISDRVHTSAQRRG